MTIKNEEKMLEEIFIASQFSEDITDFITYLSKETIEALLNTIQWSK